MSAEDKLQAFKAMHNFSKQELIQSLERFEDEQVRDNIDGYSEAKRVVLRGLFHRFRKALADARIPTMTEDWWFYDIELTEDSIDLGLWYCKKAELAGDGGVNTEDSLEHTLMSVKCDHLTVDEYASLHGVTTTTVRQWIRRGQLRSAVKVGRDWIIPALTDNPSRGHQSVSYAWDELSRRTIQKFPYLADADSVFIDRDEDNSSRFTATLFFRSEGTALDIQLTAAEREKLELALLSDPRAQDTHSRNRYAPPKNADYPEPNEASDF